MSDSTEDVVRRLDAVISALKSEFVDAQNGLAQQISATNDRLGSLLWILTENAGSEAGGTGAKIERVRVSPLARERAEAASGQQIIDLEKAVAELKSEIALLRSQEAWMVAANQDLSERLVAARAEAKTASKASAAAESQVATLTKALDEQEETTSVLRQQLEQVLRNREDSPETIQRLSAEIAALRYDNTRLRAGIEDAEARAAGAERRQRILLESAVISNGQPCKIGELLVAAGVISRDQLAQALEDQETEPGRMIGAILMEKGQAAEEDVSQAVACQCHLPFICLRGRAVAPEAVRLLDAGLCRQHQCVAVRAADDRLYVAMANPKDKAVFQAIEQRSGRHVVPLVATSSDVASTIASVFGPH